MKRALNRLRRTAAKSLYRAGRPMLIRILANEAIVANPYIAGKYFPLQGNLPYHIAALGPDARVGTSASGLPVPPSELWEGWGPTAEDYLASGRQDTSLMLQTIEAAGEQPDRLLKILDLGCAAGRMLRFLPLTPGVSELWGLDVKARHIAWCQQNLSPPFRFAMNTTAPHLPFEDHYFDLVYCGSVFTHTTDLADAWFLELRRILRSRGLLYITIHDENSIAILMGKYRNRPDHAPIIRALLSLDERTAILSQKYAHFSIHAEPRALVFYNSQYAVGRWSQYAEFLTLKTEAMDYQSGLLFRK
jgi:SAM-dependent methyltransferase